VSLSDSDPAGIIAVGAGTLLVLSGAAFKAVNLRGDANSKWSSRIDLAVVALDEKTVAELKALRAEIDDLVPDDDAPFDPAQAIIDPAPLSERVERTAKFYRARVRMENDLDRVRRLGRVFVFLLLLLMISVAMLTIHYAELFDWSWARTAGLAAGAVSVALLIFAGAVYGVCMDRLASGEILADTAGQGGGGS
jgi:hypothetical protein